MLPVATKVAVRVGEGTAVGLGGALGPTLASADNWTLVLATEPTHPVIPEIAITPTSARATRLDAVIGVSASFRYSGEFRCVSVMETCCDASGVFGRHPRELNRNTHRSPFRHRWHGKAHQETSAAAGRHLVDLRRGGRELARPAIYNPGCSHLRSCFRRWESDHRSAGRARARSSGNRGKELSSHVAFTVETGVQVYSCDPHSPWYLGPTRTPMDCCVNTCPRALTSPRSMRKPARTSRQVSTTVRARRSDS